MSEINKINRGHVGRIPNNRIKTGIKVENYLDNFVKTRGICASGDVVKEGMKHRILHC